MSMTRLGEMSAPKPVDHDWLCEETAWITIEKRGWIATPMLLMWLTRFVKELEIVRPVTHDVPTGE